jgi:hypothetical protein
VPLLAAALVAASCSDPSGPEGDGNVQVRAFSRGVTEWSGGSASDVNSLEIERVYVVLGRVKLETAGDGTNDFTDERPLVIELGQDQGPVLAVTADVPAGTYKELELAIDKLEPGHPLEQSMIDTYPGLHDASILVEGTLTLAGSGPQGFSFAAALDVDLELIFTPPLTISSPEPGSTLLSLVLDASGWFYAPTGELVNPLNEANRSVIEAAIQKSIELFEDPERDGRR